MSSFCIFCWSFPNIHNVPILNVLSTVESYLVTYQLEFKELINYVVNILHIFRIFFSRILHIFSLFFPGFCTFSGYFFQDFARFQDIFSRILHIFSIFFPGFCTFSGFFFLGFCTFSGFFFPRIFHIFSIFVPGFFTFSVYFIQDFASLSKSFREMNKTDQRRLLAELNGEHVENTCIPDIVVSPEEVIHHDDLTIRSLYQQTVYQFWSQFDKSNKLKHKKKYSRCQ